MRVLSFDGGSWNAHEAPDLAAMQAAIAEDDLTWVRAPGLSESELIALSEAFGLHPLTVEDVQTARQRPKVEDYPGMTFVVLRVPRLEDEGLVWQQVGLFLGEDFLITASADRLPELDVLEKRILASGLPRDRCSPCTLLHLAVDALVDAWFPYMDSLEDRIEEIEDEVLEEADKEALGAIRDMKNIISRTRKVSSPMREAMLSLERNPHPNILDETRIYLRDVSDHMVRLAERLEHVKETTLIAQETWNSTLANQQNETMKRLTVIAALLLFPTLIAGIGGMNFTQGFPPWDFWAVTAVMLAFILGGFFVAWWRKWL